MKLSLHIRKLKAADMDACIALFQNTVHVINARDYTQSQLNAWAPPTVDKKRWESLLKNIAYVAEYEGQIVGFGDITHQGYFDRLFVHKDFQRKGVASALIQKLEEEAKEIGIKEINAEISITAKPLAEAFGYHVSKQQIKEINGEKLINFVMIKKLCS